jgi:hypothetical protein
VCVSTTTIIGGGYDLVAATFVVQWIINFRRTALKVRRNISVKLSIAANSSVRIIVYSTATRKTVGYVQDVALAANILTWVVISVSATARTMLNGIQISYTAYLSLGIVGTRTTSG